MRTRTVVGRLCRAAREEVGLTQSELAGKCGVTESWIAHIEAGRAQPSAKVFREMVRALGVPRESLLMQEDRAA